MVLKKRTGRIGNVHRVRSVEPLESRRLLAALPVSDPFPASVAAPAVAHVQQHVDVSFNAVGKYILSWTDRDANGIGSVHVQAYDAQDRPAGEEIVIASNFGRSIENAAVAMDQTTGRFAVVYEWQESPSIASDRNIWFKLFSFGSSTPLITDLVNTTTAAAGNFDPDVAMTEDGRFLVAWESRTYEDSTDFNSLIRVRSFDRDGHAQGDDSLAYDSENLENRQRRPSLDMLPNGKAWAVAWEDERVNVQWAFFAPTTDQLVPNALTRFGELEGTEFQPKVAPAIAVESEREFVIAVIKRREYSLGDNVQDEMIVQRYKDGQEKDDCGSFCESHELGFSPASLQPFNNAALTNPGQDIRRPAIDVVPDATGNLVYSWSGVYNALTGSPGVAQDTYFKEYTNRNNGMSVNFTEGEASGAPSAQYRWGRVNVRKESDQTDPAIAMNHSGYVIAYSDSSDGRIWVRRYQSPIDLVSKKMQSSVAPTNASRIFQAGQSVYVEYSFANIADPTVKRSGTILSRTAIPNDFSVSIFLRNSSGTEKLLGSQRVVSEDVLQVKNLTASVFLPAAGDDLYDADGAYQIILRVDVDNEVVEINEANNTGTEEGIYGNSIVIERTQPLAPQFQISEFVNTSTIAPGGATPFTQFWPPQQAGTKTTFVATTNRGEGLYQYDSSDGSLAVLADTSTAVPGGVGKIGGFSFYGGDFFSSSLDGTTFFATDAQLNKGIYLSKNGTLSRIADQSTAFPGAGNNEFISDLAFPVIAGDAVAFVAFNQNFEAHLLQSSAGQLKVLVGPNTSIPGVSQGFVAITSPSADGDKIAFRGVSNVGGNDGIYLSTPAGVQVIADTNTLVPGTNRKFTSFNAPGHVVLEGNQVAFLANDEQGGGVYWFDGQQLRTIANYQRSIPEGVGSYDYFDEVSLNNGTVYFEGGNGTTQGVYASTEGVIIPFIKVDQSPVAKTLSFVSFNRGGADNTGAVLQAAYQDGSQGLLFGRKLNPSAAMKEVRALTSRLRVEYTIEDGPLSPQDVIFYRSPIDGYSPLATELDRILINDSAMLTTGSHVVEFDIGLGPQAIGLPGAGMERVSGDYYIIAKFNDGAAPLSGIYQVTGGPVMVHGSSAGDNVAVRTGSTEIEINSQILRLDASTVLDLEVRLHGGDDLLDTLAADKSIAAWLGQGDNSLFAGSTLSFVAAGTGDDRYVLGKASQVTVIDEGGDDELDLSTSGSPIKLDLDSDASQELNAGMQLTLQGSFEEVIGTDHKDQLRMSPLTNGVRRANLDPNQTLSGDTLEVDGNGSVAEVVEGGLLFAGQQLIEIAGVPVIRLSELHGWTNPLNRLDVNGDGIVSPIDALVVINELNRRQSNGSTGGQLDDSQLPTSRFYDVDGNRVAAPIDALVIINALNRLSSPEGELVRRVGLLPSRHAAVNVKRLAVNMLGCIAE
jgi:hypothetical protein